MGRTLTRYENSKNKNFHIKKKNKNISKWGKYKLNSGELPLDNFEIKSSKYSSDDKNSTEENIGE